MGKVHSIKRHAKSAQNPFMCGAVLLDVIVLFASSLASP